MDSEAVKKAMDEVRQELLALGKADIEQLEEFEELLSKHGSFIEEKENHERSPSGEEGATMNDKWKMFKNYLHNELHVSDEDIKGWIRDAVFEVAEKYLKDQFSERKLENRIVDRILSEKRDTTLGFGHVTALEDIKRGVISKLSERISLTTKDLPRAGKE